MENEMITDDFHHLSLYLLSSPLKGKESLNICKGLLEHQDNVVVIDSSIAKERGVKAKDVLELSRQGRLNKLLNEKDEELKEEQRKLKRTLLEISEKSKGLSTIQFVDNHRVIESCYLKKTDCYQEEDIDKVVKSLESLGVHQDLCKKVRATLKNELSKRLKKQAMNTPVIKKILPGTGEHYISDQEYKKIKKEIGLYFDTYKMEAKRDLTEEERLYCAHLLLKIDTDPNLIKTFFFRTEKEPNMENPIGFYNHTYDKLKFYKERFGIEESLDTIENYLGEIFITNQEDYQFWKQEIENELSKVIKKIPMTYEYELQRASAYQDRSVQKAKK